MEELIEEHSVLRGATFGFIHTLIPLIGFYTGWSINRFLKIISNGAIAGIVGIVLAHIIAATIHGTGFIMEMFLPEIVILILSIAGTYLTAKQQN